MLGIYRHTHHGEYLGARGSLVLIILCSKLVGSELSEGTSTQIGEQTNNPERKKKRPTLTIFHYGFTRG